jgi:hypothetical protein
MNDPNEKGGAEAPPAPIYIRQQGDVDGAALPPNPDPRMERKSMADQTVPPDEKTAKRRTAKQEYDHLRYLKNRDSQLEYARQYAIANKEHVREYKRQWKQTTKVARRPYNREWARRNRAENPEKSRAAGLKQAHRWRQANLDKARAYNREQSKRWTRENPDIRRAQTATRRLRETRQTPAWVVIAEIYEVYKHCPRDMHVDHIVPLRGMTAEGYRISGLHVPWNLQYLTPFDNVSKNNRMREEDHAAAGVPVRSPRQLSLQL